MRGFSVSLYPADKSEIELLSTATPLAAWPGVSEIRPVDIVGLPDGLTPVSPLPSDHAETRAFLTDCCEVLIATEDDLNALDAKSGDGDTGSTLAGAARALIAAMDRLPLADHTQLFRAIGLELSQTMGGVRRIACYLFCCVRQLRVERPADARSIAGRPLTHAGNRWCSGGRSNNGGCVGAGA